MATTTMLYRGVRESLRPLLGDDADNLSDTHLKALVEEARELSVRKTSKGGN